MDFYNDAIVNAINELFECLDRVVDCFNDTVNCINDFIEYSEETIELLNNINVVDIDRNYIRRYQSLKDTAIMAVGANFGSHMKRRYC